MKVNQNAKNGPLSYQKMKCSFLDYIQLLMIGRQKCTTKVPQNDLEWPILPNSQLFQSFSTKMAQDNSEWPILPDSQLFQSFPTEVAQNDSEHPNLHGKKKKKHYDTREFL